MADESMRLVLEALEDGPLSPADIGTRLGPMIKRWVSALLECKRAGLVELISGRWKITLAGRHWLKGKAAPAPAPVRQHKSSAEPRGMTVGEEFAALRRRRRAL